MIEAFLPVLGLVFRSQVQWQQYGPHGGANPDVMVIGLKCIAALMVGFAIGKVICCLRKEGARETDLGADIPRRTPLPSVQEPEMPQPPPPPPRRRRPEVVVPPESWRMAPEPEPPLYPRRHAPYGGRGLEDMLREVEGLEGPDEPARGERREPDRRRPRGRPTEFFAGLAGWPSHRQEERARGDRDDPFAEGGGGFRFEGGRRRRL